MQSMHSGTVTSVLSISFQTSVTSIGQTRSHIEHRVHFFGSLCSDTPETLAKGIITTETGHTRQNGRRMLMEATMNAARMPSDSHGIWRAPAAVVRPSPAWPSVNSG